MYSEFDKKDSSQQTKSTDQLGCLKSELNIQQKLKKIIVKRICDHNFGQLQNVFNFCIKLKTYLDGVSVSVQLEIDNRMCVYTHTLREREKGRERFPFPYGIVGAG